MCYETSQLAEKSIVKPSWVHHWRNQSTETQMGNLKAEHATIIMPVVFFIQIITDF